MNDSEENEEASVSPSTRGMEKKKEGKENSMMGPIRKINHVRGPRIRTALARDSL